MNLIHILRILYISNIYVWWWSKCKFTVIKKKLLYNYNCTQNVYTIIFLYLLWFSLGSWYICGCIQNLFVIQFVIFGYLHILRFILQVNKYFPKTQTVWRRFTYFTYFGLSVHNDINCYNCTLSTFPQHCLLQPHLILSQGPFSNISSSNATFFVWI